MTAHGGPHAAAGAGTEARPYGLILAGGAGRRMGGADKALLPFRGATLLAAVQARLAPQVARLALSANGDPARFAEYHLPVLPDPPGAERLGPLSGLLAGLDWAAEGGAEALLTVSVDTPFLPLDLAARLMAGGPGPAIASSAGRTHPTCGLWPVTLRRPLAEALAAGERRIGRWAEAQAARIVDFTDATTDPFLNINRPEDLLAAERIATG